MAELAERIAPRPRRDGRDYAVHLRHTQFFVPRAWDRLTLPQRRAVVERLVVLDGGLWYQPPRDGQRLIRLTQAALRLRAMIVGQSLDERGFWGRDR